MNDKPATAIRNGRHGAIGAAFRRGEDWHDYLYYSLYEAFEKIAAVFDERERYEALSAVHDEMLSNVESSLPPEAERPTVGPLSINSDFDNGSFYAYPVHEGNGHKQSRELGMRGAFDDVIDGSYAQWDYEQLLEVDPDAFGEWTGLETFGDGGERLFDRERVADIVAGEF